MQEERAGSAVSPRLAPARQRHFRQRDTEPLPTDNVLSTRAVESAMYSVFYVIGVIVVVLALLSLVGLA